MVFDLQIDQPDLVTGAAHRGCHQFEAQWLEPQKDLGVHQRARMDPEKPHRRSLPDRVAAI